MRKNTNKKSSSQKRFTVVVLLLALVALLYFKAVPFIKEYTATNSFYGKDITVVVKQGATPDDVAQTLKSAKLIDSELAFKLKYKMNRDKYKNLYFGTFVLNDGMCLADVLKTISKEPASTETFSLVIPEGYTIEMIAQKCEKLGLCKESDFLQAAKANDYNYDFIAQIPDGKYNYKLQGFLFPCTYEFYNGVTPHEMIDKMLATFSNKYFEKYGNFDNVFKNITVASLVEREAVLNSERPMIAGVIYNRLASDMLLQIDAGVVYAKTNGLYTMKQVVNQDLKVDSPYNIYQHKGLPPGPICNPGATSIDAAIHPTSNPYYYYHTDETKKDGSHIFTETFDDHLSTMK